MTDTELMQKLVVGNTELGGGKLKKGMGVLKSNFGVGPNSELSDIVSESAICHTQVTTMIVTRRCAVLTCRNPL